MPDLALYQPDIPGNTGTLLRLGACMGCHIHIIEPAGFRLDDKAMKRAGMDYLEKASLKRHLDWEAFQQWRKENNRRLILLTTKGAVEYTSLEFQADDILLLGRESSGVPETVHNAVDERVFIAMQKNARSLNVALSGAMVLGEAIRQTNGGSSAP